MKKNLLLFSTSILALSFLAACGGKGHTHQYDTENIVWNWTESSDGKSYVSASATFTCPECTEKNETHSVTLNAVPKASQSKPATCTEAGEMTYTASVSFEDEVYSDRKTKPIGQIGHSYDTEHYVSNGEYHWFECDSCHEEMPNSKVAHAWDYPDYETIDEAAYGHEGNKRRTCTVCHYLDEQGIPAVIPSIELVQGKIDTLAAIYDKGIKAYQKGAIEEAKEFYNYLPDGENGKDKITGYDVVALAEKEYNDNYYEVASSYVKGSPLGDYAGSWDGELEQTKDDKYYDVIRVNMEADGYAITDGEKGEPGSAWDGNGFNSITLSSPESLDDAEKITFSIYNPNSEGFRMFCLFNRWDYATELGQVSLLNPGWNDITLTIYKGCRNTAPSRVEAGNDITDIVADGISIMFQGDYAYGSGVPSTDKCNRDFYITPMYGVKTTSVRIVEVKTMIAGINENSTKEQIAKVKDAYFSMSASARATVSLSQVYAAEGKIVDNLIDALPSLDDVTYADKEKVNNALKEYEALDEEAKTYVTKYDVLQALLLKIDELGYTAVINLIDALPNANEVTMMDGSKIANARKCYDELSDDSKSKVTNVTKLEEVEEAYNASYGIVSSASSYTYYNFDNYNGDGKVTLNEKTDATYGDYLEATTEILTYGLGLRYKAEEATKYEKVVFYANVMESNTLFSVVEPWWSNSYDFANGTRTTTNVNVLSSARVNNTGAWVRYEMSGEDFDSYTNANGLFIFFNMGGSFNVKLTNVYGVTKVRAAQDVVDMINALPEAEDVSGLKLGDLTTIANTKKAYNALSESAKALVSNVDKLNRLVTIASEIDIVQVSDSSVMAGTDWTHFAVTGTTTTASDTYGYVSEIETTSSENNNWPAVRFTSTTALDKNKYVSFYVYNPNSSSAIFHVANRSHLNDDLHVGVFDKKMSFTFLPGWNYVSFSPSDIESMKFETIGEISFYNYEYFPENGMTGWKFTSAFQSSEENTFRAMVEGNSGKVEELRQMIDALPSVSELDYYHMGNVQEAMDLYNSFITAIKNRVGESYVNKLTSLYNEGSKRWAVAANGSSFVPTGDYGLTFSTSRSENTEKGIAYELNDVSFTGDWFAAYFNNPSFNLSGYTSVKFWLYNPTTAPVTLMVWERANWNPGNPNYASMQPGWNEVSVSIADGYFPSTSSSGFFGLTMNKDNPGTGWLITNLYAIK